MEKVTIIIPVYNGEKTIKMVLESVIKQTYENLEIIIIDDFSKDKSFEICKEFTKKDSRIRVFRNNRNEGVSFSRNKGINKSTGDYIAFLDADDKINNDFIEKSIYISKEYNADVVINGRKKINNNIETYISANELILYTNEEIDYCKKMLLTEEKKEYDAEILGFVTAKLYKRSVIEDVRFFTEIRFREDTLFNYFVFSNANCICVNPYIGYEYIINENSVSLKWFSNYDEEIKCFYQYLLKAPNSYKFMHEINYCGLHMYMNYLKHFAMHHNKVKQSSYRLIKKSVDDEFWTKIFKNVNDKKISFPYKVLKLFFEMKFVIGIMLLFKINYLRRK